MELHEISKILTLLNFNKEGGAFIDLLENFIQKEFDSKFEFIVFLCALHKLLEREILSTHDVYNIGIIVYTFKSECKGSILLDAYIFACRNLFNNEFDHKYTLTCIAVFLDECIRSSTYEDCWMSFNFLQTPSISKAHTKSPKSVMCNTSDKHSDKHSGNGNDSDSKHNTFIKKVIDFK